MATPSRPPLPLLARAPGWVAQRTLGLVSGPGMFRAALPRLVWRPQALTRLVQPDLRWRVPFRALRPLNPQQAVPLATRVAAHWNVRPTILRPVQVRFGRAEWEGRTAAGRREYRHPHPHRREPEIELWETSRPRAAGRRPTFLPGESLAPSLVPRVLQGQEWLSPVARAGLGGLPEEWYAESAVSREPLEAEWPEQSASEGSPEAQLEPLAAARPTSIEYAYRAPTTTPAGETHAAAGETEASGGAMAHTEPGEAQAPAEAATQTPYDAVYRAREVVLAPIPSVPAIRRPAWPFTLLRPQGGPSPIPARFEPERPAFVVISRRVAARAATRVGRPSQETQTGALMQGLGVQPAAPGQVAEIDRPTRSFTPRETEPGPTFSAALTEGGPLESVWPPRSEIVPARTEGYGATWPDEYRLESRGPALPRRFAAPGVQVGVEPLSYARPAGLLLSPEVMLNLRPEVGEPGRVYEPRPAAGEPVRAFRRGRTARGETEKAVREPVRETAPLLESMSLPPAPIVDSQARQAWPILQVLPTLQEPAEPREAATTEPVAVQMLRRMLPERTDTLLAELAALPALGPGEPLPPEVRAAMQVLVSRELGGVRLYTSPLVQRLGAAAFTTGQQVVLAPGRMDLRTPRGLALLGHELTHLGLPLAFKTETGETGEAADTGEREARQREQEIQRLVSEGWPNLPEMEVRRAGQTLAQLAQAAGGVIPSALERAATGPAAAGGGGLAQAAGPAMAVAGGALPFGRLTEIPTPSQGGGGAGSAAAPGGAGGEGGAGAPDLDALARQVYARLKTRLRAERERHELY